MSLGSSRVIVVLDGAECPASLEAASGCAVYHAGGALQAAALITREHPRFLLIRPDRAWHRSFVATLPWERRPAVIGVGGARPGPASLVDEWFPAPPPVEEAAARLALADRRAEERRRRAAVDAPPSAHAVAPTWTRRRPADLHLHAARAPSWTPTTEVE